MKKSFFYILVCVLILSLAMPVDSNSVMAETKEPPAPTPNIPDWKRFETIPEGFEPDRNFLKERPYPPEFEEMLPGKGEEPLLRKHFPRSPELELERFLSERDMPAIELKQYTALPLDVTGTFPGKLEGLVPYVSNQSNLEMVALTRQQVQSFDCASVTDVPQVECQALVALYDSTTGAGWTNSTNWLTGTIIDDWYGVYVQYGHVTALDLGSNQLTGTIPPEMDNLVSLWYLYLNNNQLSGNIPTELGNLVSLKWLYLHSNRLTASNLLWLGNLTNLRMLNLSSNLLTGSIPSELGSIVGLNALRLNNNMFSGDIPDSLTNLVNLCEPGNPDHPCYAQYGLDLGYNYLNISGYSQSLLDFLAIKDPDWAQTQLAPFTSCESVSAIPVSECEALVAFYNSTNGPNWTDHTNWLENNQPSTWYGVYVENGHVVVIDFLANRLSGSIPAEIGNLPNLEYLCLFHNQLTGSIPPQLGNLSNLDILYLTGNQFTGSIPSSFGNLIGLRTLDLSMNQLSGNIPSELGNMVGLRNLALNNNLLSGDIPVNITNLINLCTPDNTVYPCAGQYGLDLGYNYLNTSGYSQSLLDFLAIKDPDWAQTQLAPFTSCEAVSAIPVSECEALVALYNSTDGPNWTYHTNWMENNQPGTWYGVTVTDGHVTELDLYNNNLVGSMPSELVLLSSLTSLHLGYNYNMSGVIPAWLGSMTNLQYLNLFFAGLSGTIPPEIGSLTNLTHLYLSWNSLVGDIPSSIGNLTNLRFLDLSWNQLTGPFPEQLTSMTKMRELSLENNQFSGALPSWLGSFTSLQQLFLGKNEFSGSIPPEWGNLTGLLRLSVHHNQLSGSIPLSMINLVNLCLPDGNWPCWDQYGLDLGYNYFTTPATPQELADFLAIKDPDWATTQMSPFTGCEHIYDIPVSECEALVALFNSTNGQNWIDHTNWLENNKPSTWFGVTVDAGNVTEIWLGSNHLVGTIPPEIGNLSDLQAMYLYLNQLTGNLPPALANMNSLQYLSLFRNQLTGNIPTEMGNMTSLQALSLSSNQLSGTIPVELGNLSNLRSLSLGNNQLSGTIPIELSSLSNLEMLSLSNNQLTGSIPSELATLTNLISLYLFGNQLTGGIPSELGSLARMQALDLSQNQLNGGIPMELGNLTELVYLWLNNNTLTGSIPAELGNITQLTELDLSHNQLNGLIPPELGNLTSLNGLWLDDNLLMGDVPASFTNLISLCTLDNQDEPCWGYNELDLGYNRLNVPAPEPPASFLTIKDPDWYLTQAVEEEIPGEEGGTIVSNDGNTVIDIPAGAVEGLLTILFAPQPYPSQDIGDLNFAGNSFELTASIGENPVTTFAQPLTLTLQYDQASLGVIPEDSLILFYWDADQLVWLDAASTCEGGSYTRNLEEDWLSLPICHLSEFTLLGDSFDLFLPSVMR